MRLVTVVTMVLFLAVGSAAAEDKLFLKDGQIVSGKILSVSQADIQIQTADETMRVPRWAVEKMEREGQEAEQLNATRPTRRTSPDRAETKSSVPVHKVPESTPALLEWVDFCVEKMGSEDDGVRAGAVAALRLAGPAARPALERAAESGSPTVSRDAKRLLSQVERVEQRIAEQNRKPKSRNDLVVEGLELNDEQAQAFREVIADYQVKQREISTSLRNGDIDVNEVSVQMKALGDERDEQLAKVLTEDQLAQYRDNWAERK